MRGARAPQSPTTPPGAGPAPTHVVLLRTAAALGRCARVPFAGVPAGGIGMGPEKARGFLLGFDAVVDTDPATGAALAVARAGAPSVTVHRRRAGSLSPERYSRVSTAGRGAFGCVGIFVGEKGGPPVAVKTIHAGPVQVERDGVGLDEMDLAGHKFLENNSRGARAPCVASRVVLAATGKGPKDSPGTWTVCVMEPCEGALDRFDDSQPASPPLPAEDGMGLVLGVVRAVRHLFDEMGTAWIDAKVANVLFTTGGPERPREIRIHLGDMGAFWAGKDAPVPIPTFPLPWMPIDEPEHTERAAAWGTVAVLLGLFGRRLVCGLPEEKRFEGAAWRPLAHDFARIRGQKRTRDNLVDVLGAISRVSYDNDRDAGAVRDLVLRLCSFTPATPKKKATVSAKCLTFDRVTAAIEDAKRRVEEGGTRGTKRKKR